MDVPVTNEIQSVNKTQSVEDIWKEIEVIYRRVIMEKQTFPEIVKRHKRVINEVYPKSNVFQFFKKAKIVVEF